METDPATQNGGYLMKETNPPKFALRFLRWFCPPALYEGIEGDLLESFDLDCETYGYAKAKRIFVFNTMRFFRPGIIFRNQLRNTFFNNMMLKNYLKVATRNIAKRKLYSFINAFGLSIGLAFCILIYLFIRDEQQFDQFHADKENIYRIHTRQLDMTKFKEGNPDPYTKHAYLPAKLGEVMLDELPEVVQMTRYDNYNEGVIHYQDKHIKQRYTCVDSGFFNIFSFRILDGSHINPLKHKTDVVLTPETAKKYFGNESPVGKELQLDINNERKLLTVTAVIEAPPANSSINYEMLVLMETKPWFSNMRENWGNSSFPTFVKLQPHTNLTTFSAHLDALVNKYMAKQKAEWREYMNLPADIVVADYSFMNLQDIHRAKEINWEKVSDPQYAWILGGIAALIMLIACINYISLALTTSASRRIEVGIRKVVGAYRSQLVYQFGFESVLLAGISLLIGLGLAVTFLPYFNEFTGKQIDFAQINLVEISGVACMLMCVVGIVAGGYPSVFLSRFLPAQVLKGRFTAKLQAGFTKPLLVFQFSLSVFMIICSIVMYRQMQFITTKDLGFNQNQVLVIPMQAGWTAETNAAFEKFTNEVIKNPDVVSVAGTSASFSKGFSNYGYLIDGKPKSAFVFAVDTEYIPMLGLQFIAGRNFDSMNPADSNTVIVNEALVKDMGWTDPLQEYLNWNEDSVGMGARVIGVLKDYHFMSMERSIEPMFLSLEVGYITTALVKLTPNNIPEKLSGIRAQWSALYPDKPFEYSFMDEDVQAQYNNYKRWSKIMGLSTIFAIVISCLGLFGLTGINALNRTREIGIRKVMGAKAGGIFILLNKQYLSLLLLAFGGAVPLSWYIMDKWLQSFKFSIPLGWPLYVLSITVVLVIALVTVSYHALKAAAINPAETLKYE